MIRQSETTEEFEIHAELPQGCLLSHRLLRAVLPQAVLKWRDQVEDHGLDSHDGPPRLLDLRFAGRILLFGDFSETLMQLLRGLVQCLQKAGLSLNAAKMVTITTYTQPPTALINDTLG